MEMIADGLLLAGALGAALYCHVLAGRLKVFSTLENGMGGAIAVLSAQVDDMTRLLQQARSAANGSVESLAALTERAEGVAARLELTVASLHDLDSDASQIHEPELRVSAAHPTQARRPRITRARSVRAPLEAAE